MTAMEDSSSAPPQADKADKAVPAAAPNGTRTTTTTTTTKTTPIPTPMLDTTSTEPSGGTKPASGPKRPAATRTGPAPDLLSDKATLLLIRRTLCPTATTTTTTTATAAASTAGGITVAVGAATTAATTTGPTTTTTTTTTPPDQPIEDLLPPLTSRNDVDRQLYALLAIVVREFVLPWYGRISPHDEQFVTALVHLAAHATRAVEQRLRRVDCERLLLDELPALLDHHVRAHRAAHGPLARPPVAGDPRAAYHALWPLPALEPVHDTRAQEAAAAAYRQLLVQGVLAALLPPEDLANECLAALVGQLLADLLLGDVLLRRVAEPWMLWETIGLLARITREKMDAGGKEGDEQAKKPVVIETTTTTTTPRGFGATVGATASSLFWSLFQLGFVLWASLRFLVASVALARTLPPRTNMNTNTTSGKDTPTRPPPPQEPPVPVLCFALWPTAARLAQLDARMPWLCGALSLLQWLAVVGPGRIAALDRPLDRLLSHHLRRTALDPALLPTLLRAVRASVFPGNKFGAAPPSLVAPADAAAEKALRRRTAEAVYALWIRDRPPSDAVLREIDGSLLAVFDDAYCNKHLLYGVLEAVLVRLVPELADGDGDGGGDGADGE